MVIVLDEQEKGGYRNEKNRKIYTVGLNEEKKDESLFECSSDENICNINSDSDCYKNN